MKTIKEEKRLFLEATTKQELYNYMKQKINSTRGAKVFYLEDKYTKNAELLFEDWTWYCNYRYPRNEGMYLLVRGDEYEVNMRTRDLEVVFAEKSKHYMTFNELVDEWWNYIKKNYQ